MSPNKIEQKVHDAQKSAKLFNRHVVVILIAMMLIILALISAMLAINVLFGPGYNIPFFLISTIFFVSIVLSPASLFTSSLLGAVYGWLNKNNIREGISLGLKTLLDQILFGGLTILQVTTGFLATWPFEKNPAAFFYVLCGAMLLTTTSVHFRLGLGRFFSIIVVVYTGVVIVMALWSTLPEGVSDSLSITRLSTDDWSVSSDSEPRTVHNGTVKFTRIGQVEEFYAKGEVQLLNQIFSQGSCLAITPISKFFLRSLPGNRKNFLTPRSGEKEWVMVEARRAGTCPNPQT